MFYLYYNSNNTETISAVAFKLDMTVRRLMHDIYAHARVDDLDRDARSQWLGRGNNSALNYLDK